MGTIRIENACEGNLKDITLEIPKNKLVVFTGLSGSGKSTLLIDVLFNECQRQYLEAMSLEGIHKPKVGRIRGASPAVLISQTDANRNPRSTVGTNSDIYTDLRMVYEKLGVRTCPYCGRRISAADCREETEKIGTDFFVYMYCCECGRRMDKITRTHFSFNTKEGACSVCEGLGIIHTLHKELAVNEELSPEAGAAGCLEKQYREYQNVIFYAALRHYGVPVTPGTPVCRYSGIQKSILYEGVGSEAVKNAFPDRKPPKTAAAGRFEGVLPILWRRLADRNGDSRPLDACFSITQCSECKGERLGDAGRNVTVNGIRLPQLTRYSLEKLYLWVKELGDTVSGQNAEPVKAYLLDMETKLNRFIRVGLGYLTLDRQTITLSGGELQRLRLAAVLDSDLSGVIYILDEPTVGLHPRDTQGLITILKKLRDMENTVLVIEHDADMMAAADYIVDMGPGAGKHGGNVVAQGTLEEIKHREASVTGSYLLKPEQNRILFRKAAGPSVRIENADRFNLKDVNVEIPSGCLTAVTGPSGSGKSTLIFEVLAGENPLPGRTRITGLEQFEEVVEIGQSAIPKMRRSNVATYSEVYTQIRTLFAQTREAKAAGLTARHFSFNTPGGRCENCEGLGYIDSNMLFFANVEVTCPVCGGKRFNDSVLAVNYKGLSVQNVLQLSAQEAADFFAPHPKITRILNLLLEAGLGYLELGQTLTTLSGGEGQRLKLARELIGAGPDKRILYLMDEPTTGLHPLDVRHFLILLNRLVDAGNTVVVVEHNQQLIRSSDWVIDLGPEGGDQGGTLVFTGTPAEMLQTGKGATAQYL